MVLGLAVVGAACGDDDGAPALDQPDAAGRALVEEFVTLITEGKLPA